jgi:lipopolysaccharide export system permease protein
MVMGRAFNLVDLIISKGVSPSDLLLLIATLLPTFFSISLPLAFLMGMMIGFGRMSADGETVALKSAGIGLLKMSSPVFLLALVFALLTGVMNIWGNPWGYKAFATKSFEIARQKATIGLQPRVFMNQFNDLVLYANEVDNRTAQLNGIFIVEKSPEATSWVFAQKGDIHADERSETVTIHLHDGVIHRQLSSSVSNYQLIHFRNYDIQPVISEKSSQTSRSLKPKELSTGDLWSRLQYEEDPLKQQGVQAELHSRLSSALAPLLFVLFGLPFSMQSHRSGRGSGFIVGPIIFIMYYFIQSTAFTLTKDTSAPPWLTYWLPHMCLVGLGLFLLRRATLEKPNILSSWLDQTLLTIQKWAPKNVDD